MPSFDIVSEVDDVELKNAVDNSIRELDTRFDFRGVDTEITFKDHQVTLSAEADFQCQQMVDILRNQLSKRNVDPAAMEVDEKAIHSGKHFSLKVTFKQGIEVAVAKKLIKQIKDAKLKVQTAIQGESIRVTGKKRDDLQSAQALVREANLEQPFQFTNRRD